ncbi:hypothetical protein [Hymenobacter sp.]|uniref:hypothetical protein n=1 Tax=Hymenobacter sp. TaxID=1898978 RepID=UPI00286D3795|nr:hypothetical protein [Hymenobacter sp.]
MTVREQIIKEVATTDDSRLLLDLLAFLKSRQRDPGQPPRGSYESIIRHKGTLSKEDADEMTGIIDREFNNIEGEW